MTNISTVNDAEIDRLISRVQSFETIDFMPLMVEFGVLLENDNRDNALAGIDGFDVPMIPVTYRPDQNVGKRKAIDYSILSNNNLSSQHYRTLDGPPLAPRGDESRIHTEFVTDPKNPAPNYWQVLGGWENYVTIDGTEEILPFHAGGPEHNPRLPIRDVFHVRPSTLKRARDMLVTFIRYLVRGRV